MAIRLAIVDSRNNEVLTYPSEEFLKEFIEELPSRWFFVKSDHFRKKHVQKYDPQGGGSACYTQDLYFYEDARKHGYRFACDTRVKVGHYDYQNDIVW